MAKKPVKAKSRAITGRSNSKSSFSFSRRAVLFALVGILSLSVIAGLGWQQWQDHRLKAGASGWTTLVTNGAGPGTMSVYGCKTSMAGGYGPVWKITFYTVNWTSVNTTFRGTIMRNGQVVSTNTYVAGPVPQIIGTQLYASQLYPDKITTAWAGRTDTRAVSGIASC